MGEERGGGAYSTLTKGNGYYHIAQICSFKKQRIFLENLLDEKKLGRLCHPHNTPLDKKKPKIAQIGLFFMFYLSYFLSD
jgi:hypothetical protein